MTPPAKTRIAYFISAHGFGHAARAAAVMERIAEVKPTISFDIFTTTPQWFFQESLSQIFSYHFIQTDVGLSQTTPFHADLPLTLEQLNGFYPLAERFVSDLACQLTQSRIALVVCDISPLGIEAARQAQIPCVLIENFTWDWIYAEYEKAYPEIKNHIQYLKAVFQRADYHIQTEPICERHNSDLTAGPASRKSKQARNDIRNRLGIKTDEKMILITTGGIKQKLDFLNRLKIDGQIKFVIPGGSSRFEITDNIIQLPHHSEFFHPDLVNAADAVIGKAGYSTIAEVFHARIPFGYVARPDFRESDKLTEFIQREIPSLPISEHEFQDGSWIIKIEKLLALPSPRKPVQNGADMIADFIGSLC